MMFMSKHACHALAGQERCDGIDDQKSQKVNHPFGSTILLMLILANLAKTLLRMVDKKSRMQTTKACILGIKQDQVSELPFLTKRG